MLEKQVSRRGLIQGLATMAALAVPVKLLAQEAGELPVCPSPKVKVLMSEISNNHGHEFIISLEDLVKGGTMSYSIKGRSGHPHGVQINSDVIVQLLQGKTLTLASTTDAGHAHNVTMKLVET